MLCLGDQNIRNRLIGLVGSRPDLKARELSALLSARTRKRHSIQAIHKQLRRLVYDGMVVREGMKYRLDLSWLSELERFAQSARVELAARSTWPKAGKSIRLSFPNPEILLQWMTDAAITLIQSCDSKSAFEYCPSLWQGIVNVANERRFWSCVNRSGLKYRITVGTSSALDAAYRKLMPDPTLVSLGHRIGAIGPYSHVIVIGRYIIEIVFAPAQLRLIRQIFGKAEKSQAKLIRPASEFKNQRGKIRVKVSNDLNRAEKLGQIFVLSWTKSTEYSI